MRIALGFSASSLPLLKRLRNHSQVDSIFLPRGAGSIVEKEQNGVFIDSPSLIIKKHWEKNNLFVFVGSIGAVVRLISPFLIGKDKDPAVLVIDASGNNVIPLIGCHKANAEEIGLQIAAILGSKTILTGNSRTQDLLALDCFGYSWGWKPSKDSCAWNNLMIAQSQGKTINLDQHSGTKIWSESKAALNSFKGSINNNFNEKNILNIGYNKSHNCSWHPPTLWIGIGCEKDTSLTVIERAINELFSRLNLAKEAIAGFATVDIKSNENALLLIAKHYDLPIKFFPVEVLSKVNVPNPSEIVNKAIGTYSVAESSALLAAGKDANLISNKEIFYSNKDEKGASTISVAESKKPFAPKRGELHLVGIGPGDLSLITNDARSALSRSIVWIGYKLYLDLIDPLRRNDQISLESKLTLERDRCDQALDLARQGIKVALVSSGESGIYGMAGLALEKWLDLPLIERPDFLIHPGISAMQLAAAKIGAPLMNDFCVVSLSDKLTPWDTIKKRIEGALIGDFVICIYNPQSKERDWQLQNIFELISQYRNENTPVALARNLGRIGELVEKYKIKDFPFNKVDMLTLVLIGNSSSILKNEYIYTVRGY